MPKVLVIALDGATLDLIRPWAAAGYLPALRDLMARGVSGPLTSTLPPVTSPAWPSFMTGKNPGKHGVFDFIRPRAGTFEMVNAGQIQSRTLWEILSQAGLRVGVLNVPVTHPPRRVNGFLVPGLLSPDQGHTTHPPDFLKRLEKRLGPFRITPQVQYKPGLEADFTSDLLDLIDVHARYASQLLESEPWDFFMVHFLASDVAQHALWRFLGHDPHVSRLARAVDSDSELADSPHVNDLRKIFARLDRAVGELAALAPADTLTMIMSDHGFGPLNWTVNLNLLFLEHGLLSLKQDAWARLRAWAFRKGLTPSGVYRGLARLGAQDLAMRISRQRRNAIVGKFLSFEDVDWERTRAYSMGHVGQIYVNLQGREPRGIVPPGPAYEGVRREVQQALKALRDPDTGQPLPCKVIPGESYCHGPYANDGPDLHVVLNDYKAIAFPLFAADGRVVARQIRDDSGCHRREGLLIVQGPGIQAGRNIDGAEIVDLAPTILHAFGLPIPQDMDGAVLADLFREPGKIVYENAWDGHYEDSMLSAEDAAKVESHLRDLGYLE